MTDQSFDPRLTCKDWLQVTGILLGVVAFWWGVVWVVVNS